ncbi:MAG: AMP-binding protein [Burkholderiaceae bacterium]|jgi:acyl-coenzyme A synthetase/AMP-(fatty) acid ligase|nr:AMP-binding protein [Burkholderiaceae bacterium]
MTDAIALSTHAPTDTLVFDARGAVPAGQYFAEVLALAPRLAGAGHVINLCADRYAFMVGLGAALAAGVPTLMPSSTAVATVSALAARYPALMGLHDEPQRPAALPAPVAAVRVPDSDQTLTWADTPMIAADQLAAIVFTSGSQGEPTPHLKHWGKLCLNAAAESARLSAAGMALVATVPAQHMYGFESSVLLTLHGGASCWRGKPFYPADVTAALAAAPRPRMLVITPFHLGAVLDAGLPLPACESLLCATAPLPLALAERAEAAFGAPLYEIYGCTESGQIASRRTCAQTDWQLLPGVRMEHDTAGAWVHGGHVEARVRLPDVIEPAPKGRFQLVGRHADMVNIAGKRTSIAYLNAQLLALQGVKDGCFVWQEKRDGAHIERLAALCVAPSLDARQVLAQLRTRIDPAFLPRPLLMVAAIPRNATGKLVRSDALALLRVRRDAEA